MSEERNRKPHVTESWKSVLTVAEILILVLMAGYMFAVIESNQKSQGEKIEIHNKLIESNRENIHRHSVQQAVTNEQYKQIIKELVDINKKLSKR